MTRAARFTSALAAVALSLLAGEARGQICTIATSGLAFGSYDQFSSGGSAITGTVTVTCRAMQAAALSYAVQLGTGTGGSFSMRSMSNGASRLAYQLYTDTSRTQVWGDGSGGTGVVGDGFVLAALASSSRSYTAYGRIAPRQVSAPGSYSDQVMVLIVY